MKGALPGWARRNFWILVIAIGVIAGGEELWSQFVPRYLEALGATVLAVGVYGAAKDLLDAVYQYPGGALAARLGTARALVLFNALALVGYFAYLVAGRWWVVVAALPLVMAWQSFSLPATFAVVGETLPRGQRSVGFAWQSMVRRLPIAVGPVIGGALMGLFGYLSGVRVALAIGIVLGLAALLVQAIGYRERPEARLSFRDALKDSAALDPTLKRILLADTFVRFGQGIGEVFIVLIVTQVIAATPGAFGLLVGLAMTISIAVYLPAARRADATAREPWVTATYAFFAAFPLSLALIKTPVLLPLAFVLMGLREIGEPARKAMIVDLAREGRKSVDVGAYYLVRGLAVFPASLVGGLLWHVSPQLTFATAAAVAAIGALIFYVTVQRRRGSMM